ncbi:hypothetical protein [Botrimarina sp.]|uniref:hypothetical protein n=1 Tax=Botrimarina sp. TaxID=2795802 RepID=UPI0032EC7573
MPTTRKASKPSSDTQRAVLRSLSQQVAAELIDRPAVWLRDNPHLAARTDGDRYNARELVANVLATQPPAELPDGMLEAVRQVVECVYPDGNRFDVALAVVESVEKRFGNAGLAAVGAALLRHLREWNELDPWRPPSLPSETEFVAEAVEKAKAESKERHRTLAEGWEATEAGRLVYVCPHCKRHRFGRSWNPPPIPTGYAEHEHTMTCDGCRSKGRL